MSCNADSKCYLMDLDSVFKITPLNPSVDTDEMLNSMEQAQDLWMGTVLKDKRIELCEAKEKQENNETISEELTGILEALKKSLAWYTFLEWVSTYGYGRVSAKGLKLTGDQTTYLEGREFADYKKEIQQKGDKYLIEFKGYLDGKSITNSYDAELDFGLTVI